MLTEPLIELGLIGVLDKMEICDKSLLFIAKFSLHQNEYYTLVKYLLHNYAFIEAINYSVNVAEENIV